MPLAVDRDEIVIRRLRLGDDLYYDGMLDLFSEIFDDAESYSSARPAAAYRNALLARGDVVIFCALADQKVVAALVAYELRKFEQERSEFYIYDLGVAEAWRRRGIATELIENLKTSAKKSGGWVVYVQADHGDDPAIALYTKLGTREDVMHFDIALLDEAVKKSPESSAVAGGHEQTHPHDLQGDEPASP